MDKGTINTTWDMGKPAQGTSKGKVSHTHNPLNLCRRKQETHTHMHIAGRTWKGRWRIVPRVISLRASVDCWLVTQWQPY